MRRQVGGAGASADRAAARSLSVLLFSATYSIKKWTTSNPRRPGTCHQLHQPCSLTVAVLPTPIWQYLRKSPTHTPTPTLTPTQHAHAEVIYKFAHGHLSLLSLDSFLSARRIIYLYRYGLSERILLIEAVIVVRRTDMFILVVCFFPFFPTVLIISHAAIDSHPIPRDDAAAQLIRGPNDMKFPLNFTLLWNA